MKIFLIILVALLFGCKSAQNEISLTDHILLQSKKEIKKVNAHRNYISTSYRGQILTNVLNDTAVKVKAEFLLEEVYNEINLHYYVIIYDIKNDNTITFIFEPNYTTPPDIVLALRSIKPINKITPQLTIEGSGLTQDEFDDLNKSEIQYIQELMDTPGVDLYKNSLRVWGMQSKPGVVSYIKNGKLVWLKIFRQ